MNIKTFRADTLQDALDLVREEFGGDAVVLHTRQVERRSCFGLRRRVVVEITAQSCAATPLAAPHQPLLRRIEQRQSLYETLDRSPYETPDHGLQPDVEPVGPVDSLFPASSPFSAAPLRERLRKQDAPSHPAPCEWEPSAGASQAINADNPTLLELELTRKLREEIHFGGPIRVEAGKRKVVALVGPTGSGKTTTIAKLAACFHLHERLRVGLLSLDTFRIGAAEQLRGFADVLDIPTEILSGARRMDGALERLADRELILFDTPGTSPANSMKLRTIGAALDAARVDEVHLVFPANAASQSLSLVLERFKEVNYTDLILSKWDENCGPGNLLPVLRGNLQPLRYITTGQNVPQDLEPATAERLAAGIFKES